MLPARAPLAVLFDLDGTLADSLELILRSFRHTFITHLGSAPPDRDWIAGMGTPLAEQIRSLVANPALHEPMVATYRAYQQVHHDRLLADFAGVRETLALLHERCHPMALVTSKATDAARRALDRLSLTPYLDHVVGFDSTTRHKPDPEPVRTALALLHVPAERAVFVGDSPHDVAAGNAAGVATIAALWGPFARGELESARPSRLLDDISGLPGLLDELARSP